MVCLNLPIGVIILIENLNIVNCVKDSKGGIQKCKEASRASDDFGSFLRLVSSDVFGRLLEFCGQFKH